MRGTAVGVAYLAAYVLLDWLSYVQPVLKLGITPWNPQAGLSLAFLIAFGPRQFPWVMAAALLAEILVRDTPAPWPLLVLSSAVIASGYGLAAAALRARGLREPVVSPASANWLIVISAVATLCVAVAYVLAFASAGVLPGSAALESIARYWVGDLNGVVTLTPLLLMAPLARNLSTALRAATGVVLAQATAVVASIWLVFGFGTTDELRFFPLFVPVIWIALRWGVPGALLAALTIQIGLVVAVQNRSGYSPLVDIQFLMVTLGVTALVLGAAVTERAQALRRVAAREAEQRALLAAAPDAVLSVDDRDRIVSANPASTRMFGTGDRSLRGRPIDEFLPELDLHGSPGHLSMVGRRSDGARFPADVAWARLEPPAAPGFMLIVRDATERHAAEVQLRERDIALARAMRFAVAGELASALTHELNQPITAIVSYLRAAEIMAAPISGRDERLTETLGKAGRASIRAADVLRRLRDFYRGGAAKLERLSVGEVCSAMAQAFQERARRAGTRLSLELQPDLPDIDADRTHLEMVLHNLLTNALEAVSATEAEQRMVTLAARIDGTDILVTVDDSGPGIPPRAATRMFEPFFTTKPDGMGLGLAISRSLLRSQEAELSVTQSELGGARFIIRLPAGHPVQTAP